MAMVPWVDSARASYFSVRSSEKNSTVEGCRWPNRMPTLEAAHDFFPSAEGMIGLRPVDGGNTESSAQSSRATFSAAKL